MATALDRAYEALAEGGALEVDAAWLLRRHLLPGRPHEGVEERLQAEVPRLAERPGYGCLLDPSCEPLPVPDSSGGASRMFQGLVAPFCVPEDKALGRLRAYAMESGLETYALAHQLLAVEFWTEMGRRLPEELGRRHDELVKRLLEEQRAAKGFSDIYVERATFIVYFGSEPCPRELPEWTRTVLAAQEPDGDFGDHPWTWRYKGYEGRGQNPNHTTVLAAAVLARYLDCVEGTVEPRP